MPENGIIDTSHFNDSESFIDNTVSTTFNTILPYNDVNGNRLYYTNKSVVDDFLDTENWETILSGSFQQGLGLDDSPIFRNYAFFKNFIWKSFLLPVRLLQYMNALESAVYPEWFTSSYGNFYNKFL